MPLLLEPTATSGRRWRVSTLEESFLRALYEDNPFPDITERSSMACLVNQTPRRIQTWFQNKRQRGMQGMEEGVFSATGDFSPSAHQDLSLVVSTAGPNQWAPTSFDNPNRQQQLRMQQTYRAYLLLAQYATSTPAPPAPQTRIEPPRTNLSDLPLLPAANKRKVRTAFTEALMDDLDFGDLYEITC
jgi:hypothetical protein